MHGASFRVADDIGGPSGTGSGGRRSNTSPPLGDLYEKAGAARAAALLLSARLARTVRRPPPRDLSEAEALVRELEARRGAHPSLARIRRGLRADPADLTMIAAGIDDHLAKRPTP